MGQIKKLASIVPFCLLAIGLGFSSVVHALPADSSDSGFSLEVNPSPIVETVKPGDHKTVELNIRNRNIKTEQLHMTLRSFKIETATGKITLENSEPVEVKDWIKFREPSFNILAGEWFTEHIDINAPTNIGFTYYFAVTVSRQNVSDTPKEKAALNGAVAVFTLLNVDRPGAISRMELENVSTDQGIYEYLPVVVHLKLKNTGNTLIHPSGNVFIQTNNKTKNALAVLNLNPKGSYILPGVTRDLSVNWEDGFPHYTTVQQANNTQPLQHIEWNWGKASFRIGHYVAKVSAVYSDGQRDVLVRGEVGFWVIPWKILLGTLVAVVILVIGLLQVAKFTIRKRPRPKSWR